jgi:hypothetical protein
LQDYFDIQRVRDRFDASFEQQMKASNCRGWPRLVWNVSIRLPILIRKALGDEPRKPLYFPENSRLSLLSFPSIGSHIDLKTIAVGGMIQFLCHSRMMAFWGSLLDSWPYDYRTSSTTCDIQLQ